MTDPRLSLSPPLRRLAASMSLSDDQVQTLLEVQAGQFDEQVRMLSQLPRGAELMFDVALRQQQAQTVVRLRDGTAGCYERGRRTDDCFAAALATCLEVPIGEVPDPRIDERLQAGEDAETIARTMWQELAEWLAARGLVMNVHATPPVELPRWIGIVRFEGHFNDHTLVMSRDEVLFDPVDRSRHSRRVRTFSVADVSGGFSFEPAARKRHIRKREG